MGRFRVQLLLKDITWSTQYTIAKNSEYSNSSIEWTILNLDFTVEIYGINLFFMIKKIQLMLICALVILQSHILYIKWII